MSICIDIQISDCRYIAQKLSIAKKDSVIIAVGKMAIEYMGRASSYAYPAHRLLILKPDGTLLVHESEHVEPLNWQPPKSITYFECIEDKFRVRAIRRKPHEEIIIEFTEIDFIKTCRIASTKLSIIGREADIVRAILINPSIIEENAYVVGIDVATAYGKIDILLKKEDKLIIVEVKNEKAGIPAIIQLRRYVDYYSSQGYKTEGVLIAPEVSQDAIIMLTREGFKHIDPTKLKTNIKINKL